MRSLTAAFLTWTLAAGAQQPAPEPGVTFRSTSQLVVETVAVKDREGKPIEGLTAADFTVTENGVPQKVSFCEFQKLPGPGEGAPALSRRPAAEAAVAATGTPGPAQIVPEAPGDLRYRDRRLLALYFDISAMQVPDQLRAFSAAQKFIRTGLAPADLVAVMKFSGGALKVLLDFTDDRERLAAAIGALAAASEGFDDGEDDDAAADSGAAFGQNDGEFNIFNTDRQLSALQTAARMLGGLNEKKALIYFASGLRLSGVDNQAQLRATLNAAVRANVAFYPIDARGLTAEAPMGDATRGSPGGAGMYTGAGARAAAGSLQRSQDPLYALAADTGGKALFDSNDLARGIVQAQQAISSYYVIGYYTTSPALDGKYRRISIQLKEHPSAKLDYRQGYFAGKEFARYTQSDRERQLEEALMLADPITELTIAMEVNFFQLNRAEYYVPVMIKVPGRELALAQKGGAERTRIDFIGEIRNEYGSTIQNIRDKVEVKLSGVAAAELARRHIQYDAGYTLLPGSYAIKVLARDLETGRIGTYQKKFVVPNLNRETRRVPISSVVLSSQRIDLKEALYSAGKDREQTANPLVQDGQKLIPSVTRVFSRTRDMYVYLQAYENSETAQPLVAYVSFYRGRVKAFETPPMVASERLDNRLKTAPLKFSIALTNLPAGRYNCQVTVLDPKGGKAAFWQAPVKVAP